MKTLDQRRNALGIKMMYVILKNEALQKAYKIQFREFRR